MYSYLMPFFYIEKIQIDGLVQTCGSNGVTTALH